MLSPTNTVWTLPLTYTSEYIMKQYLDLMFPLWNRFLILKIQNLLKKRIGYYPCQISSNDIATFVLIRNNIIFNQKSNTLNKTIWNG